MPPGRVPRDRQPVGDPARLPGRPRHNGDRLPLLVSPLKGSGSLQGPLQLVDHQGGRAGALNQPQNVFGDLVQVQAEGG